MLDNRYALLFIRGERPVLGLKYDILKHPAIGLTADGKAEPYVHGEAKDAVFTIELVSCPVGAPEGPEPDVVDTAYEILSEEDVEKSFA